MREGWTGQTWDNAASGRVRGEEGGCRAAAAASRVVAGLYGDRGGLPRPASAQLGLRGGRPSQRVDAMLPTAADATPHLTPRLLRAKSTGLTS